MNAKIKIITYIIILALFGNNQGTSCNDYNLCMGCDQTQINVCTACFNWGDPTFAIIGPRSFDTSTSACNESLDEELQIKNCKFYSGLQSNNDSAIPYNSCRVCSKTF